MTPQVTVTQLPNFHTTRVLMELVLIAMSPEDIEWFQRNAPPDWVDHMSAHKVVAGEEVSDMLLASAYHEEGMKQSILRRLEDRLAEEIVKCFEPRVWKEENSG